MRGAIAAAVVMALSAHAAAATFVVNSTLDTDDKSADGLCRDANNKCTLRAAITEANRDAAADVITFAITGSGTRTIAIASALSIFFPVTIDGTTQSGYAAGAPIIGIDGAGMAAGAFVVSAESCEIRGLRLEQLTGAAVSLVGSANAVIRANHFVGNGLGVEVRAATAAATTLVGGVLAADRNVFSTNVSAIAVADGAHDVQIIGNYLGTDATGSTSADNSMFGVQVDNARAEIRNNVIAGGVIGVSLVATTGPIVVADNSIGTNAAGTVAFPNSIGIYVQGGMTEIVGNTIAGSGSAGIRLTGPQCVGTIVRGNHIGVTAAGLQLANATGIRIEDNATASMIGGTQPGERNVIGGTSLGIVIASPQTTFDLATQTRDHTIVGNYIGVLPDGTPRPNTVGVWIGNAANNHVEDNTISSSTSAGIVVIGELAKDNSLRRNSLFDNGGPGIDLGNDLVNGNDVSDVDTGPNDLQNYPVLAVGSDGVTTWIGATLDTAPLGTYEVDIFSSPTCTGGQAKQYLGTTTVTSDANGTSKLLVPFPLMPDGVWITATATSSTGATSELSSCVPSSACTPLDLSTALADGAVGVAYSAVLGATGSVGIYDAEIVGGALPTGLALLDTGELTGIPEIAGQFSFTVRATDLRGCVTTQALTMRVCPQIAIDPEAIGPFAPRAPVDLQLTASGGTPPYQYWIENGPNPLPGLQLSLSGLMHGTPTLEGRFTFIVNAIDQTMCTGSQDYAISVGCLSIDILPYAYLPVADLGAEYKVVFTASGGAPPYRFVASGVPTGLEFSSTGVLAGMPRERGATNITVTAIDGVGCQRQVTYELVVDVSNPPGCESGEGRRPSSLAVVMVVLVVTLRRRRLGSARCR
jgi:CSLREA domain-containing protein